ncbi:hypothetical protein LTR65_009458 [Meristemomyces frigidus]
MAVLAEIVHSMQQGMVRLASVRTTGKGATAEHEDSETTAHDKAIDDKLDKAEWSGILRDLMNVFKGTLGKESITNKKGGPAKSQADRFLELLGESARQEHQEHQLIGEPMEVEGEEGAGGGAPVPRAEIHALATSFSAPALEQWYLKLVKAFDLGPKRGAPKKSPEHAAGGQGGQGGKGKKRNRPSLGAGEEAAASGSVSPTKKQKKKATPADDDDEYEEEDEQEQEGEGEDELQAGSDEDGE